MCVKRPGCANLRYVDNGKIVTSECREFGNRRHAAWRRSVRGPRDRARRSALDPRFVPPDNSRLSMGIATGFEAHQRLGVLVCEGLCALRPCSAAYLAERSTDEAKRRDGNARHVLRGVLTRRPRSASQSASFQLLGTGPRAALRPPCAAELASPGRSVWLSLDARPHRARNAAEVLGADFEQPTPEDKAPPAQVRDEVQAVEQPLALVETGGADARDGTWASSPPGRAACPPPARSP